MNLKKKKNLAARTLGVSKDKIIFVKPRLEEIKEAITKQDIRDLHKDMAILIKEAKGRKKMKKRRKKSPGNIKVKVNLKKKNYVTLTRTLRRYSSELKKQGKLSKEELEEIRKKIRNKDFRNKPYLKNYIKGLGGRQV